VSGRLILEDVHKRFETEGNRVDVLKGASFEMGPGENMAITGPSGSGKSTLLQLIGTLDQATSGRIEIGGQESGKLPEVELARFRNKSVGFVFQDHHLLPQYSVLENVLIPTHAFGNPGAGSEERAAKLLDRVELTHRLQHRPAELSGGERQRAAVARALIQQPDLLLCDEPTGSLDGRTAQSVASLLFELHREENNILIIVTHSLDLAQLCTRRIRLQDGKCIEA
jgi:lipoprotein-releasing system ATP-binding protein